MIPFDSSILFSVDWWRVLVELWNETPNRAKLAGLGRVTFKVVDAPSAGRCIEFDVLGTAVIAAASPDITPTIEGRRAAWEEYIQGNFNAVDGVLTGRFVLAGGFGHLVSFASGFDELARVARTLC